jgi:hypothetical protein
MISFNNIGYMGRLGNQMFQYAAVKGIAKYKGYWYSIPNHSDLFNCFKIQYTLPNTNTNAVYLEKYEFDQNFVDKCPDDIDIIGYFQSEKYFKHIENEIRSDFTFKDIIIKNSIKNKKDTELISLHIRRTDYLTDSNFECLDLDYYYDALKLLPNFPVLIFSDDPKWCREKFTESRFTISNSNNHYVDLCSMSQCDYHIIANSSFSWWASWLSKSKQTIAPKKWFCGEFSNWNTKDLYLPNWILI